MTEDIQALAKTVGILRDEVLRLNKAVGKLEVHMAGRSVRMRDASLTSAGVLLSVASLVWLLQTLGVLS